jgi:hypothetical protein
VKKLSKVTVIKRLHLPRHALTERAHVAEPSRHVR